MAERKLPKLKILNLSQKTITIKGVDYPPNQESTQEIRECPPTPRPELVKKKKSPFCYETQPLLDDILARGIIPEEDKGVYAEPPKTIVSPPPKDPLPPRSPSMPQLEGDDFSVEL